MALGRKPIDIVNEGKHELLTKAKHWGRVFLGEIATVQNGFAFSSRHFSKIQGIPLIRIRDIGSSATVDRYSGDYNKEFVVQRNDVLIGMDGDFRVARWKGGEALLNQRVCRVTPKSNDFNFKFLYLCLQPFLDAIHSETSSVTVKHISSKTIEEIPLPYPPLAEQDAIVSKIEELFSELDKGIENLRLAQQLLKTYRQAVLKWAFEGKLTNRDVKDGELPKGWIISSLEHCLASIDSGKSYRCNERPPTQGEIGILKVSAISWGVYDENESKTCFSTNLFNEKYLVRDGDFLFSRANTIELVGACVIVTSVSKKLMLSDKILRFSFSTDVNPRYVLYYLKSQKGRKEIETLSTGNQESMRNIGQEKIKQIKIPLCLLAHQSSVVQEIEGKFEMTNQLESELQIGLQKASTLRQSILKQAFEGKLLKEEIEIKEAIKTIKTRKLKHV